MNTAASLRNYHRMEVIFMFGQGLTRELNERPSGFYQKLFGELLAV